jgi:hypothetical protein
MKRLALMAALLFLCAGCAHAGKPPPQFALGEPLLCRHCNCYLPADADPSALCTVCNCGYRNAECVRGR